MAQAPARFPRIDAVPAYRKVADTIERDIVSGRLRAGDALGTEAELVKQFGVNRSTVREGIRLLEETGMLRRINPKRLVVSRPTKDELSHYLERGMLLHEVSLVELWETAMVIEPRTAALAAAHLQPGDIEALERNVRDTEAALGDAQKLTTLDIEFHALVARGVHNRVWQLTREPMARLFYPAFEAVMTLVPESGTRLVKAHRQVLSVLKQGDEAAAAEWMEKHIKDFRRGIERAGLDLAGPALRPTTASRAA
jgi:DNA-binding FadR family transcriptional regulator